jgi:hypothetical protein
MEFKFNIQQAVGNYLTEDVVYMDGDMSLKKYNTAQFNDLCYLLDTIGMLSSQVIFLYKHLQFSLKELKFQLQRE